MNGFSPLDRTFMTRALQLARCGIGGTSPNPLVGAVIVSDGRIIGEGYHIRAGEPHAEVNAVNSVKDCDRHLLPFSTMYVTLEPCSHYGKTPPCCDLIIAYGIPRVVIAATDANLQVNGMGIQKMSDAGVDVSVGLLKEESLRLNAAFFSSHLEKRPYITLKWAQTADGFVDSVRSGGQALQISDNVSRVAVHKLRASHDAILVGTRTALLDNPSLNLRYWAGRTPLRLVIDRLGVLPGNLSLFDGSSRTVVFTARENLGTYGKNVEHVVLDFDNPVVPQIIDFLYRRKINSLLVEGGPFLLQTFIDAGLWDEARIEVNPSLYLKDGVEAPVLSGYLKTGEDKCSGNQILYFRKK